LDCFSLEKKRKIKLGYKMKFTKTIKLSVVVVMVLANIAFAEGELSPVTIYEIKAELKAIEVPLEPVVVKTIATPLNKTEGVKKKSPWYVGAGLVVGELKWRDREDETYGFMARIGCNFSQYVGVEARGIRTNWDDEGGKIKHLGAFVKPQYPISEELNLYALAGYAKTSVGTKRNFSDTGLAYGVGLDYALNEDFGLFVDYEQLLHDAGEYDLYAFSLGASYGF
jgi:opacity protein-like surface antigen